MPVLVTCFKCGRKLRIHDHLIGRKARCPACQSIFMTEGNASDPPATAEPEFHIADYGIAPPVRRPPPTTPQDEEVLEGILHETEEELSQPEHPRPIRPLRRKPISRSGLENVRIGVTLKLLGVVVHVLGIIISIGVIVPVAVSGLRAQKDRPLSPENIGPAVAGVAIVVIFIALIAMGLSLAGYGFCLAAPEKHGAKTLAIIVLSLGVLAIVPACLAIIIPVASFATSLIELVESFLFLFFLRALARCLDSKDLEDRASTAMRLLGSTIAWFFTIPVMVVLLMAVGAIDSNDKLAYGIFTWLFSGFFCIGFILGLAYMIWLIWSLAEARYEIGYYLDRNY